jgi:hypothetical protein
MGCMQTLGKLSTRHKYPNFSRANRPTSVNAIGKKSHITLALAYVSSGFQLTEAAKMANVPTSTAFSVLQRPEIKRYIREVVNKMEDKAFDKLKFIEDVHKRCIDEGFVRDKSGKIDGTVIQSASKELSTIWDIYPDKKDVAADKDEAHLQELIATLRGKYKSDH